MLPVDVLEAPVVHLFTAEQLDRRHAVDVLVEKGVDARDPQTHFSVRLAHVPPEPLRENKNQRQHREGNQGKPPVHPQQRHHDADEHEQIAERGDDARREQIVDDVDVGRHPRHQPPDGVPVVERQIQPLQVGVNLHAHVEHDALADHLHHVGLCVFEGERRDQHREVCERDVVQPGTVSLRDVLIDGDLDEIRRCQLDNRVADERQERTGDVPLVRTQVRQQAAHQPRIVGLAEDFFFVERHGCTPCRPSGQPTKRPVPPPTVASCTTPHNVRRGGSAGRACPSRPRVRRPARQSDPRRERSKCDAK